MTDEEYHEKMHRTNHSNTCSWGWDQYWWECDCGTIPVADLRAEKERRDAKPMCRCGRPATVITKPSMLLCDKCARKIFPNFR